MNDEEFRSLLALSADLRSIGVSKHDASDLEKTFVDPQGLPLRKHDDSIDDATLIGALSNVNDNVKLLGRRGSGKSHALALAEHLWIEQRALPVRLSGPAMAPFLRLSTEEQTEAALFAYFLEETLQSIDRHPQKHGSSFLKSLVVGEFGGRKRSKEFERELPELLEALRSVQVSGAGPSKQLSNSETRWSSAFFWETRNSRNQTRSEGIQITLQSLEFATRKLIITLQKLGVTKVGLFVDDVSELDIPSRHKLTTFLQRLSSPAEEFFCVKLSVYPGHMYDASGFDAMKLVIASTDPLFYRAGLGATSLHEEDTYVLENYFWPILKARLEFYDLGYEKVFGASDAEEFGSMLRKLFWFSSGLPRACGSLLYSAAQLTKPSLSSQERFVTLSDLERARNMYFDGNISKHVPRYMTFVSSVGDRTKAGIILSDFMRNLIARFLRRPRNGPQLLSSFIATDEVESALGPLISIGALMKRAQFEFGGSRAVLSVNYRRCVVANLTWDDDAIVDVDDPRFREELEQDSLEIRGLLDPLVEWLVDIGCEDGIRL